LYLIDIASGRVTELTDDPAHDSDPVWSPDGSTIAFTSDRGGTAQVCLMRPDGSKVRCLTDGVQPAWSPDGKSLTFYRYTPDGTRIFLAKADGSGVTQIS
jgi:TolB protein